MLNRLMPMRFTLMFAVLLIVPAMGEYLIANDGKPSHLHHKFENFKEVVFPSDIKINVSLSRLQGTLLYSIDKNRNQLIVTLYDSVPPILGVEFNQQRNNPSLSDLCSCERCEYKILKLRIQVTPKYIYLTCKDGKDKILQIHSKKGINKNYPILYPNEPSKLTTLNEAHLWLVNTPTYGDVRPSSQQMYGCIFEISYASRPIYFNNYTSNIKTMCKKACVDNICNGGQCYETYGDYPICNCTTTFLNGPFCNDSIKSMNLITKDTLFVFDSLKISWRSNATQLLILNSTHIEINLQASNNNLIVTYLYHEKGMNIKVILTKGYVPDKEYIVIIHFHRSEMKVWFLSHLPQFDIVIWTGVDLSREIFSSLRLQSGDGVIDVAYKYEAEYKFKKIQFKRYIEITKELKFHTIYNGTNATFGEDFELELKNQRTLITVSVTLVFLILVVVVAFVIRCLCPKIYRKLNSRFRRNNEYGYTGDYKERKKLMNKDLQKIDSRPVIGDEIDGIVDINKHEELGDFEREKLKQKSEVESTNDGVRRRITPTHSTEIGYHSYGAPGAIRRISD